MALDIGSIRLKRLLDEFVQPQDILKATPARLMQVSGIGEKIAQKISSIRPEDLENELKLAKKLKLNIITYEDKDYPENLRNIYDPPIVLYVKGKLKSEDANSLAIVGSRKASIYGLSSAEKFAAQLAENGLTIVSGMARGVDTFAHQGAIKAGGRTIAVMGSGFNHIYPSENKNLCAEIAESCAVISELPINTQPFAQNFPRRNRVISGLSLGVLVVEAARNSGALITVDFALQQGREVYAVPGKIDSTNSFGTNALIQQGAKLVTCVDDILEELSEKIDLVRKEPTLKKCSLVDKSEDSLYELINKESVSLDELIEKSKMDISQLSGILLRLQIKKLVRQLPGKYFVRS